MTLRPPPEHGDKRWWHWVQDPDDGPDLLHWDGETWAYHGCGLRFRPTSPMFDDCTYLAPVARPGRRK